jgi:hypothetical protein
MKVRMVDKCGAQLRWQVQYQDTGGAWTVWAAFTTQEEMRELFAHIKVYGHKDRVLGEWDTEFGTEQSALGKESKHE